MNEPALAPCLPPQAAVPAPTYDVRGLKVVLDADLARLFSVPTKRLNEQLKRNADRFGGYAFQLDEAEAEGLRSQIATSNPGRGGARYRPWVFTEHGVVMAASLLKTDVAIAAMRLVVEVFVAARREGRVGHGGSAGLTARLQAMVRSLMDSIVDQRSQTTVRDEAQELLAQSIRHLKDRLERAGLENEEIAARAAKLLAEADLARASAMKSRAEAGEIELRNLARRLLLVLEAEQAISASDTGPFLRVLHDLSGREGLPGP